jgi:hypothetical protein
MAKETRIIQITSCTKGDYVNVYGLDETSHVWRWNPVADKWEPYHIAPRADRGGARDKGDDIPF